MDTPVDRAGADLCGAKTRHGLTEARLRELQPGEPADKDSDGGNGLYVVVPPGASRSPRQESPPAGRRQLGDALLGVQVRRPSAASEEPLLGRSMEWTLRCTRAALCCRAGAGLYTRRRRRPYSSCQRQKNSASCPTWAECTGTAPRTAELLVRRVTAPRPARRDPAGGRGLRRAQRHLARPRPDSKPR